MKVLFPVIDYPPIPSYANTRFLKELTLALSKEDIDCHILTFALHNRQSKKMSDHLTIHYAPYNIPFNAHIAECDIIQKNIFLLGAASELISQAGDFDLVHLAGWDGGLAAGAINRIYDIPLVATFIKASPSRYEELTDRRDLYVREMEKWSSEKACAVLCTSEEVQGEIKECLGIPANKIHQTPLGINETFALARGTSSQFKKTFLPPGTEKLVTVISEFDENFDADSLLDAIALINPVYSSAQFVIAGSGPGEESLLKNIYERKLNAKVTFAGYVSGAMLGALYGASDVILIPKKTSSSGMSALEAMTCKKPIIATRVAGITNILDDTCALLIEPGDAQMLASAILKLVYNDGFAEELACKAYEKCKERFTAEKTAQEVMQIYEHVTNAKHTEAKNKISA